MDAEQVRNRATMRKIQAAYYFFEWCEANNKPVSWETFTTPVMDGGHGRIVANSIVQADFRRAYSEIEAIIKCAEGHAV